jgi:hypothetical protein
VVVTNGNKILVGRGQTEKRKLKIQEECSVCHLPMKIADSLQLACTHRYHKDCALKMQWKMSYKCELCEGKKNKRIGILKIKGRRRGGKGKEEGSMLF